MGGNRTGSGFSTNRKRKRADYAKLAQTHAALNET
ncbi:hypothetical protein BH24DEI2_BH24DEI2_23960 [soil metagenome]